jgi:hypothetical protein
MTYYETQQQNPQHWGMSNPAWMQGTGYGLGQAASGQQYGQYGAQPFGGFGHNAAWGAQPQGLGQQQPQWWGQQQQPQGFQRQLSPQDVNEVVRQLLPALPQILALTQQPYAGIGYGGYGQASRTLSQQDVNEVVRQILPIVPQIVGMLQGQPQMQYAALQGSQAPFQQSPFQHQQSPFQYGAPQFQAAFGIPAFGGQQQRLTQQDVADVARQLVGLIPQVIGNLQAFNQQRMN